METESAGGWLVFAGAAAEDLGLALRARLGQGVRVVRPGSGFFGFTASGEATIDPARREDYAALAEALQVEGWPATIVHAWAAGPAAEDAVAGFEAELSLGCDSLLYLVQALIASGLDRPLQLVVVGSGFYGMGGEVPSPARAAILGLLRVIPQEYRYLACRALDVAPGLWRRRRVLEHLVADLAAGSEPAVAYRSDGRWLPVYDALRLPPASSSAPSLRPQGVYLLTGGFGAVGAVVARFLAEQVEARLVLVGRTALPSRETWPAELASRAADDPLARRMEQVEALEALGASVLAWTADVTDRAAMAGAVAAARQHFGALHGVLHLAAGGPGEGLMAPLESATPLDFRRQLGPKVGGAQVLREVLADAELDFCLVFSSLAAILGGLGFAAYAAAGASLDALVRRFHQEGEAGWTCVDWDGWQTESVAVGGTAALALLPAEGTEALARLLPLAGTPQIVVSTGDLGARLERWVHLEADAETSPSAPVHERPDLTTAYVAPADATQQAIAEIWQELLGVEQVGIHDSFFELGGDSLLATQLLSRLRLALRRQVSMQTLFEKPTVAGLAATVAGQEEEAELGKMEELLRRIEAMSESDALEAFADEPPATRGG